MHSQDTNMVQSVLNSAVSKVTGSPGSLLGVGELEVSNLLSGAVHLIDTWVELEVGLLGEDSSRRNGFVVDVMHHIIYIIQFINIFWGSF